MIQKNRILLTALYSEEGNWLNVSNPEVGK
jgi:hypothetical protein